MKTFKTLSFDTIIQRFERLEAKKSGAAHDLVMVYSDSRDRDWCFAMHAKDESVSFLHRSLRSYTRNVLRAQWKGLDFKKFRTEELLILDELSTVFLLVPPGLVDETQVLREKLWMH